ARWQPEKIPAPPDPTSNHQSHTCAGFSSAARRGSVMSSLKNNDSISTSAAESQLKSGSERLIPNITEVTEKDDTVADYRRLLSVPDKKLKINETPKSTPRGAGRLRTSASLDIEEDKKSFLPPELLREISSTQFVTQKKISKTNVAGADVSLKAGKFLKRKETLGEIVAPRTLIQTMYPTTNEFASQLSRILHPDDIQEDFNVEHKEEGGKNFHWVGRVEKREIGVEVDVGLKNYFRISQQGNLIHTYRIELESLLDDDLFAGQMQDLTLQFETIFNETCEKGAQHLLEKQLREQKIDESSGKDPQHAVDNEVKQDEIMCKQAARRIQICRGQLYGLIPPTDVLASSYRVQSHEVQLTWTPVVQPKCVLTIGEEVSNSQLGQAVESAKLEILNQWNTLLDKINDPAADLFGPEIQSFVPSSIHTESDTHAQSHSASVVRFLIPYMFEDENDTSEKASGTP
ncbi:uncharacterized protein LOC142357701, partial [Convolutriloba macropyga]|uniref:uncharacterized protein LOC142357701 n=1 Tax=Convolutriloba macropyga TaxID=536237 RepID=UPI003F52216C